VSPRPLPAHLALRPGEAPRSAPAAGIPTGFADLDARLPGGGWPVGALTEVLSSAPGVGEVGLILPALAALGRQGRWLAWVDPPHVPYAPALTAAGVDLARIITVHPDGDAGAGRRTDMLWAAEQALRSGAAGAVLLWPREPEDRTLRRLQLAAEQGRSWGVLFRPPGDARKPSPAALRLAVSPAGEGGLSVRVLKCRNGGSIPLAPPLTLRLP
jgi:hypothetical protein